MMVPGMQAVLLKTVSEVCGDVNSIFDPFTGAGTTLTETMRLGLNYYGQDINPLAVLIARIKAGPFHTTQLRHSIRSVLNQSKKDRSCKIEAYFPGLFKWFSRSCAIDLSRIQRAIRKEENLWCRRVLWAGLADTVRLCSNSRTTTYKLHTRSAEDIAGRQLDALKMFSDAIDEVAKGLIEEAMHLKSLGHLSKNGWYRAKVQVNHCNTMQNDTNINAKYDLLITSPPYGDNKTTVPYGQFSYLPLQWIDLADIDSEINASCLKTTCEIDSRSIGGSLKSALSDIKPILSVSPTLSKILCDLSSFPQDRQDRVSAFFRDLNKSLDSIYNLLRSDAYMIWTIGNRRVGGVEIPTDAILTELLEARGVIQVSRISRCIPSKRMAPRNNIGNTIKGETILLFRKASSDESK